MLPRAAAQIAQERYVRRKDRAGCGGPRDPKSPEIGHMGFLHIRRDARAILYDPRDLSFFDYRLGYSEERVDPGRRAKIFQNL